MTHTLQVLFYETNLVLTISRTIKVSHWILISCVFACNHSWHFKWLSIMTPAIVITFHSNFHLFLIVILYLYHEMILHFSLECIVYSKCLLLMIPLILSLRTPSGREITQVSFYSWFFVLIFSSQSLVMQVSIDILAAVLFCKTDFSFSFSCVLGKHGQVWGIERTWQKCKKKKYWMARWNGRATHVQHS